ncbi:FAD/NAD(P)-binding protein [Rhodococcus sp. 1R11]|uniref:FAD/NAD(P)-binding protein n=1 Tax=Rhodococcus sp. 1R11 TaxID=2559614 RepID=UPI0014321661|nr:FAD/NAD(P)-binding protein [Rhodococcus sp. 1R11]
MRSVEIAVVGAGPRGTIALERLCANGAELADIVEIVVHLIDPYPPGSGRIWNTNQPQSLLMNTVAADITVFTDDTVDCEGPITPGLSHYQWAKEVAAGRIAAPVSVAHRAQMTLPWTYPTRSMQGEYLTWALSSIIDGAPSNVRVRLHRAKATAISETGSRYSLTLTGDDHLDVDAVIFSMGHFDTATDPSVVKKLAEARKHNLTYIPPANASEVDLDSITARDTVALQGMGLNFFDYVALLTTERGGQFKNVSDGSLQYTPSGREPRLIAGSRRGVPYLARAEFEQEYSTRYVPKFISAETIAKFRSQVGNASLDFLDDVWPLVQKETAWVYYSTLLADDTTGKDALLDLLSSHPWGDHRIEESIAQLVPDSNDRLDWDRIDKPTLGRTFSTREAFTAWVRSALKSDYRASCEGPGVNPLKTVGAIMRDLRDEVRQIISHQGLRGRSYRDHIDHWFSGLNNLVASGPPRSRIAELIALVDAGIIEFAGPDTRVTINETAHAFEVNSDSVGGEPKMANVSIDAFLPKNDIRFAADPLLQSVRDGGLCRAHSIPDISGEHYETGGIDVDDRSFRLIDAQGAARRHLYTYGPPTESVQWVTAIGARPLVNSRTLLQADLIARSILHGQDVTPPYLDDIANIVASV